MNRLLLIAAVAAVFYSCNKKETATVTPTPVAPLYKDKVHFRFQGVDYYDSSRTDSTSDFDIVQGNILIDMEHIFAKEVQLKITPKAGLILQLRARKYDETQDTGIYKMGFWGTGSEYGSSLLYNQSGDDGELLGDTTYSRVHVSEYSYGTPTKIKGTFSTVLFLTPSYVYDTVRGDFELYR